MTQQEQEKGIENTSKNASYKCKDCPHGKEIEQYPKALFCKKIWCWVLKEDNECGYGWDERHKKVIK